MNKTISFVIYFIFAFMTLSNYLQEKGTFTTDELKLISHTFSEVSFEKKSMLLEEGNICRYLFFITSGLVKTYFIDRNWHEVIINFASENWWITDIHSFEEKQSQSAIYRSHGRHQMLGDHRSRPI